MELRMNEIVFKDVEEDEDFVKDFDIANNVNLYKVKMVLISIIRRKNCI